MDIKALAVRLESLPEWPMREARLRDDLLALPISTLVQTVERMLVLVRQRRAALHVCYISLLRLVVRLDREAPHTVHAWMLEAAELRYFWAAAFLSHPPDEADDPDYAKPRPDAQIGALTLGERKAWARRASTRELERYFPIDHPHVVEILLGHPAMTDQLMVRYCARRPVAEPLPAQVATHSRWVQFPEVVDALVQNASVPQWLVLKLLPLATDTALHNIQTQLPSRRGPSRQELKRWAGRLRGDLEPATAALE